MVKKVKGDRGRKAVMENCELMALRKLASVSKIIHFIYNNSMEFCTDKQELVAHEYAKLEDRKSDCDRKVQHAQDIISSTSAPEWLHVLFKHGKQIMISSFTKVIY